MASKLPDETDDEWSRRTLQQAFDVGQETYKRASRKIVWPKPPKKPKRPKRKIAPLGTLEDAFATVLTFMEETTTRCQKFHTHHPPSSDESVPVHHCCRFHKGQYTTSGTDQTFDAIADRMEDVADKKPLLFPYDTNLSSIDSQPSHGLADHFSKPGAVFKRPLIPINGHIPESAVGQSHAMCSMTRPRFETPPPIKRKFLSKYLRRRCITKYIPPTYTPELLLHHNLADLSPRDRSNIPHAGSPKCYEQLNYHCALYDPRMIYPSFKERKKPWIP